MPIEVQAAVMSGLMVWTVCTARVADGGEGAGEGAREALGGGGGGGREGPGAIGVIG